LIFNHGVRSRMKHLTVGLFHDDTLGSDLGKKGTESDFAMFNRKTSEEIFTFISPVGDKLTAKSQIISSIDAAIVVFTGMTREVGETLVMLDLIGVSNGIAITTDYATPDQISTVIKNTSTKSFAVESRDPITLLEVLKSYNPERNTNGPVQVEVDHSFSVKGVGEVILGFVKRGIVRKYDELAVMPANKKIVVRSIQMQDEDYDQAEAGSRVGLAIKGASVDEMARGSVICAPNSAVTGTSFKLSFKRSPYYSDDLTEGTFHATIGMQTVPVRISELGETSIAIESEKPIVYTPDSDFLLLNLNAKKTRVMGKGHVMR
jgi:selenocysteine-specific translation elongation factor